MPGNPAGTADLFKMVSQTADEDVVILEAPQEMP